MSALSPRRFSRVTFGHRSQRRCGVGAVTCISPARDGGARRSCNLSKLRLPGSGGAEVQTPVRLSGLHRLDRTRGRWGLLESVKMQGASMPRQDGTVNPGGRARVAGFKCRLLAGQCVGNTGLPLSLPAPILCKGKGCEKADECCSVVGTALCFLPQGLPEF